MYDGRDYDPMFSVGKNLGWRSRCNPGMSPGFLIEFRWYKTVASIDSTITRRVFPSVVDGQHVHVDEQMFNTMSFG